MNKKEGGMQSICVDFVDDDDYDGFIVKSNFNKNNISKKVYNIIQLKYLFSNKKKNYTRFFFRQKRGIMLK
jgi:hypothetical protein